MNNDFDGTALSINNDLFLGDRQREAKIELADRGLLLGDGIFETLPILHGHAVWWDWHFERLNQAASMLSLKVDEALIEDTLLKMQSLSQDTNSILRVNITRGSQGRGLVPSDAADPLVFAALSPMSISMPFQDVSLVTSSIRRNEHSPTSRIKSLNYLDNILAAKEAQDKDAEEALFLNGAGDAACSTIGNLFAVFDQEIITPPLGDGVLPGIVRRKILQSADLWGVKSSEQSLTPDQLKKADGLFLTNSLRIVRRVTRLDNHRYTPQSEASDVITRLQSNLRLAIADMTGVALA